MILQGAMGSGMWMLFGLSALFLVLLPVFAVITYKIIHHYRSSRERSMLEKVVIVWMSITTGGIAAGGVILIIMTIIAANLPPSLD
jgi:uncharacterized membrane protein